MTALAIDANASINPDPTVARPTPTLTTVLVQGSQPGPGMWRIKNGDHTLWILGTVSPLPDGMTWRSGEVEATIAGSEAILGVGRPNAKIGFGTMLKMASLAPAAVRSQSNPGKATLASEVGPSLFARWRLALGRYGASANDLESKRPVYASQLLYWQAVNSAGLSTKDVVTPVVTRAAQTAGVPTTGTSFSYALDLDWKELKQRIDGVNRSSGGDIACFEKTLDVLESDVATMKLRANAWALGDIGELRRISRYDPKSPCREVEDATMAFLGASELKQRLRATWLLAAQDSLTRNNKTFATLPISDLLDENGVLMDLKKLGYSVEAPDDEQADEP